MRYETVRRKLITDLKEGGFQLRLGATIAVLEGSADLCDANVYFTIGYALGTMREYFGDEYVVRMINLLSTTNREPTKGAEILSRSHIHAD